MSVRINYEMQCPGCGHDDGLEIDIVIHTTGLLTSDGTDTDGGGDHEWDNKSTVRCHSCEWAGKTGQCFTAFKKAVKAIDHALGEVDSGSVDVITDALEKYEKTPIKDLRVQLKAKQKDMGTDRENSITADQIVMLKVAIAVMSTLTK